VGTVAPPFLSIQFLPIPTASITATASNVPNKLVASNSNVIFMQVKQDIHGI
jgi:hypothetical protein